MAIWHPFMNATLKKPLWLECCSSESATLNSNPYGWSVATQRVQHLSNPYGWSVASQRVQHLSNPYGWSVALSECYT